MSILSVNLKHLYQRKACWLLGLFLGFFTFVILVAIIGTGKSRQGVLLAPALWMLYAGTFTAALSIDVLTKPFSYCLPGHQDVPRNFLSFIGLLLAFLWSLSFFFIPGLNFVETLPGALAAFSVFTISYWMGAWITFKFKNWPLIFAFPPLLIFGDRELNISGFIVRAIWESPLLIILAGILVNVSAWRYWSRSDLARKYCGKLWMGAFDPWNKEKTKKLVAEKEKKKPDLNRVLPGVESFFIAKISGTVSGSLRQYIWGCLYKSFGVGISQYRRDWLRFFLAVLLLLCYVGYLGAVGNVVFLVPVIIVANMNLNVYSNLLISGGRRERFWSALTLAFVITIFITCIVTAMAMLTMLLKPLLPELTLKDNSYVFNALNIKLFFIPLLMIPVVLVVRLIFHKKPMLAMFLSVMLFSFLFAFGIVRQSLFLSIDSTPFLAITLLCFNWGIFIAVLRYITMRCCLTE